MNLGECCSPPCAGTPGWSEAGTEVAHPLGCGTRGSPSEGRSEGGQCHIFQQGDESKAL